MPNWSFNKLSVKGSPERVLEFCKSVCPEGKPEEHTFDFSVLHPEPEGLSSTLDWRREHWGTKWNAGEVERQEQMSRWTTWRFRTAECIPEEWILHASKLYPDLYFVISYRSEWAGGGRCVYQNDELLWEEDFVFSWDMARPSLSEEVELEHAEMILNKTLESHSRFVYSYEGERREL